MPNFEPVVIEARNYSLRHIGPNSVIIPVSSVAHATYVVLNQPQMVARPLPMTNAPNSSDFVQGQWTARLIDAGDFQLIFPNKEASDGPAWRNRFDPANKNQWIEISNDEYVEFIGCIEKVDKKRDQIVVSGHDAMFALKNAYERDWITVQAPRDVIERGTQVYVPVVADNFPFDSVVNGIGGLITELNTWGCSNTGISIGASGGVTLSNSGAVNIIYPQSGVHNIALSGVYFATCTITNLGFNFNRANPNVEGLQNVQFLVLGRAVTEFKIQLNPIGGSILAQFIDSANRTLFSAVVPVATQYNLVIESDGEWAAGYINGQLIGGYARRSTVGIDGTAIKIISSGTGPGIGVMTVTVLSAMMRVLQPFLMGNIDKGDYVLPGDSTTYPSGGLHARYYSDADLQNDTLRLGKIHGHSRKQIYAGNDASEYSNQQDATINNQQNPLPGAATSNWSVEWFGAIYLKLSAGNYSFKIVTPGSGALSAVRVWIGQTAFGTQILDDWTFSGGRTDNFTVIASSLAGILSYSGNLLVQRDGWYPIKIAYAVDSVAATAPIFSITSSPTAYTDPGGTAIASGAQTTVVPATSLSPLGCVDQRHQGISHFDLVQKIAQAYGYQAAIQPQSLESGLFPGVLAPRVRQGQDTDEVLEPDDTAHASGLINYSNTLDATDHVASLQGNGAGFQSGTVGQLQALVFDPATMTNALFDSQGWQDFSDASFASLLQALLNSQLGLRINPWQVIAGDPIGRYRLANTWPLSGTLAQQRWRPGDGMRIQARDIGVFDTSPRQLLIVTRQIHPNGSTATQVGFAARPRSAEYAIKQSMYQATRWQRNSQRRFASMTGSFQQSTLGAGVLDSGLSILALLPSDVLVSARIRIIENTGNQALDVYINGIDQTVALNGPFTIVPINLDISSIVQNTLNSLYVQLQNVGGSPTTVQYQVIVDVLM